ncbi:MAG: M4 family metallopeptidase [Hymenobacteraceae bacterium]|nr:M4 family metallopeptidase [Hymenobacteraceae bacterium]
MITTTKQSQPIRPPPENESGAMNEGFSDIWGACVENRAAGLFGLAGKNTWLIGEEIALLKPALRSMVDPKALGQPDTYQGTNWRFPAGAPIGDNDYNGVHRNSGVLNYWVYLLSQGGLGTNDKGNAYTVTGLGITKAAKIAYLTEKLLSPTSQFASARIMAIQAATTLYGATSAEVRAVTNAWYAVGIGNGIAYGNAASRFIDAVGLNSRARFSTSDNGYYDGVAAGAVVPTVTRCSQQSLLHSAGFSGAVANQYWNAYVDFNRDNDFNDAGERVISNKLVTTSGWVVTPFTIPSNASLGPARMRVIMTYGATSLTNGFIGTGEVEDYHLNIGAATAVGSATSLKAVAITTTGATLQWANVTGAASYNVQYRANTSFVWTTVISTDNSKPITGLSGSKSYVFRVQAVNGCGTTGSYTATVGFVTLTPRGLASVLAPADSLTASPVPADSSLTAARLLGLAATTTPTALRATAYPNPATDVLHLVLANEQRAEQRILAVEVVDARGARVLAVPFDAATSTLRITALLPGLYTATVRGGAQPASVRFVKQ